MVKGIRSNTCFIIFRGFVNDKESKFDLNLAETNTNLDESLNFVLIMRVLHSFTVLSII